MCLSSMNLRSLVPFFLFWPDFFFQSDPFFVNPDKMSEISKPFLNFDRIKRVAQDFVIESFPHWLRPHLRFKNGHFYGALEQILFRVWTPHNEQKVVYGGLPNYWSLYRSVEKIVSFSRFCKMMIHCFSFVANLRSKSPK